MPRLLVVAAAAQIDKSIRRLRRSSRFRTAIRSTSATLKLKCNMCHPNKDPGEIMGIPQASTCMQCHSSVKTDSPAIQKLAEYAQELAADSLGTGVRDPDLCDVQPSSAPRGGEHLSGMPRAGSGARSVVP